MMRLLFLLLLLANVALYALSVGAGPMASGIGHEPGRVAQQINPERIRALTDQDLRGLREKSKDMPATNDADRRPADVAAGTAGATGAAGISAVPGAAAGAETSSAGAVNADAAVPNVGSVAGVATGTGSLRPEACLSWGDFNVEIARRIRERLGPLKLGNGFSEQSDATGFYVVAIVPTADRAAMEARAQQMRKNNFGEVVFAVLDGTPPQYGIYLGSFRDRELATKRLAEVSRRGVSDARLEPPKSLVRFMFRGASAPVLRELTAMQKEFPQQKLKPCSG